MAAESCCCSTSARQSTEQIAPSCTGNAEIQAASPVLTWRDKFGFFKVRWGMGRMNYHVQPGLYKIGKPDQNSPVLVTANYKMTFDTVRKELADVDAWILVLDTYGINVWCAAGKGTFGTEELVRRIETTNLKSLVSHRRIILPQLGAPGVAAHEVRRRTGFSVIYGPVYARDIPSFLNNGNVAEPGMRLVQFPLRDRVVLIPMELIPALKWFPVLAALILLLRLFDGSGLRTGTLGDLIGYFGALLVGTTFFQILLPWIPGRSFVLKGWILGFAWALASTIWFRPVAMHGFSNLLVLPALSAYLALNFTGATTFTSLSGVRKEIQLGLPIMMASAALGIILRLLPHSWI